MHDITLITGIFKANNIAYDINIYHEFNFLGRIKKSKEVFGRFCIKVGYFQFFVIIFTDLTFFSQIILINK